MEISNIRNSNGKDYISFKKELFIKPNIILFNIILPLVMIYANIFLILQIKNLYLNLLILPISAFWIRAYLLYFHEIAHFNIHKNKKINDIIGNVFFTPFFGMWIKQYRKHHWKHHNHLGTHADTEVSYTCFKELEDFLVKSDLSNLILSNRSSYLKTFKSLYNK